MRSKDYRRYCNCREKEVDFAGSTKLKHNLHSVYHHFGNIYKTTFEDWWRNIYPRLLHRYSGMSTISEIDPADFVKKFIMDCVRIHQEYEKEADIKDMIATRRIKRPTPDEEISYEVRQEMKDVPLDYYSEPSIDELFDLIDEKSAFMMNDPVVLFRVPVRGMSIKEIMAAISKSILEHRKHDDLYGLKFIMSTGQVWPKQLKLYLKVYDLCQAGRTMPEIVNELRPLQKDEDKDISNRIREFRRHLKNAVKIIANTERGFFPGPY